MSSKEERKRKWMWRVVMMTAVLVLAGCSSPSARGKLPDEEKLAARGTKIEMKGGAELWAERCIQCHWARDPGTFSPVQWEVIMMHMRIRANMPKEEYEEILRFIKAAS